MPPPQAHEVELPKLEPGETRVFDWDVDNIRINNEWTSRVYGIICDLDTTLYFYDERARFIEKLDSTNRRSADGSSVLLADLDHTSTGTSFMESIKIDLGKVSLNTSSILVFLDGGPRNFQFVQSVNMQFVRIPSEKESNSLAPTASDQHSQPLFNITGRTRKDYQGVALCVIYKDGWHMQAEPDQEGTGPPNGNTPRWVVKSFLEPLYVSTKNAIDDRCSQLVVGAVPTLSKFRPRLFNSVRDICAALSSTALPRLKKKFQKASNGLEIVPFTEVIFKQLYENFPKIIEDEEAAYTVAMIQEMFHQIDYNGDMSTDWDEFTTFCIQNGMVSSSSIGNSQGSASSSDAQGGSLDEYIIEYGEDILMRDRLLSAHRYIALMRFIPELRRILVIPEDSDNILILDERFRLRNQLYPNKIQILGNIETRDGNKSSQSNSTNGPKSYIYDVIYLTGRDMFAFSSSDHSLVICKDQTSMGGKKTTYFQHNKIYHSLLHLKLCWSEKHGILCSVASDKVIYGWDIDRSQPIFQVSRHSDIITDFISLDNLDCFMTCSMDRRIVMWSATSRRVKGILLGHKRGVRSMSAFETTLLSAGFECEAMTWDLVAKDPVAILRGHRQPIVTAKLMCENANSEKDYRAITVDESGELRLWNIYVKERTSEPTVVPTLQIFEMIHPENPMNEIRFLALPYNNRYSTSYYSDLIACSTKLMHFLPEKNTKEFIPPTCCIFNESAATLMTCNGHNLIKYDVCTGQFICGFHDITTNADLSAMCLDGLRGRRVFAGSTTGEVMIVNCMSGAIIDKTNVHLKEVTDIIAYNDNRNNIYTCSTDGKLKLMEENGGKLHVHNTIDDAFGVDVGITSIRLIPSLKAILAVSGSNSWGIWNFLTFKKIIIIEEHALVNSIEILGASRDAEDPMKDVHSNKEKECLLTIVVCLADCAKVYTMDTNDIRGVCTYILSYDDSIYITDTTLLRFPESDSVNYSKVKSSMQSSRGTQLCATTDDGFVVTWNVNKVRSESERIFREHFKDSPVGEQDDDAKSMDSFSPNEFLSGITKTPRKPVLRKMSSSSTESFWSATESLPNSPTNNKGPTSPAVFMTDVQTTLPSSPDTGNRYRTEFKSTFFVVPRCGVQIISPNRTFMAHLDSVSKVASMDEHGCFVTLAHDGFHRVWNADMDCLGELPLPNLTERMKNPKTKIVENPAWKFILERIPTTKMHVDLAAHLVDSLISQKRGGDRNERRNAAKASIKNMKALQESLNNANLIDSTADNFDDCLDEHSRFRKSLVLSLNEPIALPDDAPPLRVMTKEERRLAEIAMSIESGNKAKAEGFPHSQSMSTLPTQSSKGPGLVEGSSKLPQIRPSTTGPSLSSSMSTSRGLIEGSQVTGQNTTLTASQSLWTLPEDMVTGDLAKLYTVPQAFSEASLSSSMRQGLIDGEAFRLLRRVGNRPDKVAAYDRSQPMILLRNPSLSVSFSMPAAENVRRAEVEFGDQKDMYKNAESVLNSKNNLSVSAMRNAIALNRIEHKAREVKTMVHVMSPSHSHDHVILQKNTSSNPEAGGEADYNDNDRLRSDEQKMRLRLLHSASLVPPEARAKERPLDKDFIANQILKLKSAVDTGPEWEARFKEITQKPGIRRKKKKTMLSQAAKDALEKKLAQAIKDEFKARSLLQTTVRSDQSVKKTLTTRALLPFYKIHDVKKFMDIFAKVDEDFSGDLDMDEWVNLFSSLNQNIAPQEARMIFMKVDTNGDGFLSMSELVPVVFSKATKEQQKLIIAYAESEIIRKHNDVATVTQSELEQLFEAYDVDNIGFVMVSLIRERIRAMQLPEQVQFSFMDSILEVADDDMVNLVEFLRMFKIYISKEDSRKK